MARQGERSRASARIERTTKRASRSNRTRTAGSARGFPIIGLGASAGGLEALETFFSNMPPDSGMAFAVVTHQHAGQASLLAELLQRTTTMRVTEVARPTLVERDRVYTVRPGFDLEIVSGVLHPRRTTARPAQAMPIDRFFQSLARDHREQAVGIILSGTGTDGSRGLTAIKGERGIAMVQDPASAQHADMPHSAIATRLIDYVLPVSEMPKQLVAFRAGAGARPPRDDVRAALDPILTLIRTQTGQDFSSYKDTTIRRRIERRMAIHGVDTTASYARHLQANASEIELLCKELLIGVTSFWRDPAAWAALARAVCELLAARPDDEVFRAWVPGCSTGEEAYSLAIVLRECLDQARRPRELQIFATDLDSESIELARGGVYPLGIAEELSAERLARWFVREPDAYRVRKEIRELVVFAPQNLITDPPFTRLDLLSCRNLLIYLEPGLQKKLIPIFHYALRPDGLLFLGSSETIGGFGSLFQAVDNKWKIYRRKEVAAGSYVAEIPAARRPHDAGATVPPADAAAATTLARIADRVLLRDLVPPTVFVRDRGDVVHVHGRTGKFLEPAPGAQASANLFDMAREGLQLGLSAAMRQAATRTEEITFRAMVKTNTDTIPVDLRVCRLAEPEALRDLYRITFEQAEVPSRGQDGTAAGEPPPDRVAELERELRYANENHQATIEELETANEQLKSANVELQSTTEEMQSTNEELETSKEELQSLNEELQTVNGELEAKLDELTRLNDDMKNLLDGTEIATVFVDSELCIRRFTERAKTVIRLIASDVGRPLGDLTSSLRYDRLLDDAREVLRTLVPREIELQDSGGAWYLMRILPYRTNHNLIDGLVLEFVDITKSRALQIYERRVVTVLNAATTSIFGHDRELRYRWALGSVFGRTPVELDGKTDAEVFGAEAARHVMALKRGVLETNQRARARIEFAVDGAVRGYDIYIEPSTDERNEVVGLSCMITEAPKP